MMDPSSPATPQSPAGPFAQFARKLGAALLAPGRSFAGAGAGAYHAGGPVWVLGGVTPHVDDRAPAGPMVPVVVVEVPHDVPDYIPPIVMPGGPPGLPWEGMPVVGVPPEGPLGPPGAINAVPEPASWLMLLMGGLVVLAACEWGRRRDNRLANGGGGSCDLR